MMMVCVPGAGHGRAATPAVSNIRGTPRFGGDARGKQIFLARGLQRLLSMKAVNWDLDKAPTLVASTLPSLNSIKVGMPRIP